MDGNYGLNLEAVLQHVEKAETLSILFPMLQRALVVDLRGGPDDRPIVRALPAARSASERMRSLKRLRPRLPRPRDIIVIPWTAYVDGLVWSGVWDRLMKRLEASGSEAALRDARRALHVLRTAERMELASLIRGEQYETIWVRKE